MDIVGLTPQGERYGHRQGYELRRYELRRYDLRRFDPARTAAALLIVGFVLAVASQWYGWFAIRESAFDAADSHVPTSFGMADTPSFLQVPYYLIWLAILGCSGAVVFAPESRRRAWFGAAAGALATQVLILVPLLRRPSIIIDGIVGDFSVAVQARHTAGSYLVIAALVVIAAALVVAVRGQVLPRGPQVIDKSRLSESMSASMSVSASMSEPMSAGMPLTDPLTQPLTGPLTGPLIQPQAAFLNGPRTELLAGPRTEPTTEPTTEPRPAAPPAAPDHSMYVRPTAPPATTTAATAPRT